MSNVKKEIEELVKNGHLLKMNVQFFADGENEDITNEADDNNETNEADDNSDDNDEIKVEENHEKTFTQREVNRMMAKEKRQGKASVYRELGINPKDEALINMLKAVINSQTGSKNKDDVNTVDNTRVREAEHKALVAEIKAEAMMQGVAKNYVEDVTTLVMSKLSDDTDVETLINELKIKYPVWFDVEEDESDKGNKNNAKNKNTGTSLNNKKNSKTNENAQGLGARLAAQKKHKAKASYWN